MKLKINLKNEISHDPEALSKQSISEKMNKQERLGA